MDARLPWPGYRTGVTTDKRPPPSRICLPCNVAAPELCQGRFESPCNEADTPLLLRKTINKPCCDDEAGIEKVGGWGGQGNISLLCNGAVSGHRQ